MDISFRTQPAPSIPSTVQAELDAMDPKVIMVWNPRYLYPGEHEPAPGSEWPSPRWEIWVELRSSTHEKAKNEITKLDRWSPEHQCWMRYLQVYDNADRSFAPVDERLLVGLALADTWANRDFYDEHVADAYDLAEQRRILTAKETMAGSSNYYRNLDRTLVGRHSRAADWRHRIR